VAWALGSSGGPLADQGALVINGPLKRGERGASWVLLVLIGLSEGVNASQVWKFGSPYYFPLPFVALTVLGVMLLPKHPKANM
jgi:hypothetical protein